MSRLPEGYEVDTWYLKNPPFIDMTDGRWYFRAIRYVYQGPDQALRFDYMIYGPFETEFGASLLREALDSRKDILQSEWEKAQRDRANQTESEAAGNSSTASTVADV